MLKEFQRHAWKLRLEYREMMAKHRPQPRAWNMQRDADGRPVRMTL
jgi:hypothetical protein